MGLKSRMKALEARYPWGLIGALMGLVGLAVGLYLGLHQRKPGLVFEIISEANVLDVHTSLAELTVLFRGEDIQKSNLNLRLLRIHVSNVGEADITQGSYDKDEPWGFRVEGGKAIEVRLVDATSEYLHTRLLPALLNDTTVGFPKVILESDAGFVAEVLVLHPKSKVLRIIPIGKVAGVESMQLRRASLAEQPFWEKALEGGIWVQLTRLVGYLLASIVLILVVVWLGESANDIREGRRRKLRKKRLAALLDNAGLSGTSAAKAIIDLYSIAGEAGITAAVLATISPRRLSRVVRLVRDDPELQGMDWHVAVRVAEHELEFVSVADPDGAAEPLLRRRSLISRLRRPIGRMLVSEGFVRIDERTDAVTLDPSFLSTLEGVARALDLRVAKQEKQPT